MQMNTSNVIHYHSAYGISIHSGEDTEITSCSFQNSIGTALGVFSTSLDLRGSNSFMNNCWRCSNRNHTCICVGGGIHAVTSILLFKGNNTFRDSSAVNGGGISAHYSTLTFNGHSSFRNSSVEMDGGGISAYYSTLNITGNCTFSDNSAKVDGGGIHSWYSNVTVSGNSTFRNNTAKHGGGTHAQYSTLTLTRNSCFTGSSAIISGGAVMVWYSTMIIVGNITLGKKTQPKNMVEEYMHLEVLLTSLETLCSETTQPKFVVEECMCPNLL